MTAGTSEPRTAADFELLQLLKMLAGTLWEVDLALDAVRFLGAGREPPQDFAPESPRKLADLFNLIQDDTREAARAEFEAFVGGGADSHSSEYRLRQVDGSHRWTYMRMRVVERDASGQPQRLLCLLTDRELSHQREEERSRLEAQLRHVQKLDALGQLTGGIAHDFNNILASVLGYAELGLLESGSPQGQEYFREVVRAGERGRDLIAKLLSFSRAGVDGTQQEVATSLAVVPDTLRMLRPMLPSTLTLEVDATPALPDVQMDASALQQLVLNLAINARDAVGENGLISVQIRRGEGGSASCASCGASLELGPEWIEIAVADDGSGMTAETQSRIFDPFFSTKEVGRGSGLGLSVVHSIVHEHGGHVLLASDPGSGSRFTLLLRPGLSESERTEDGEQRLTIDGAGRRLMVVDDDPAICNFMRTLLEQCHLEVDVQDDSDAALDHFESDPERYDLVITDQSMPGLSGVELADELLALRPDLPILVCSGFSEFVDAGNARELGFSAFLQKPVSVRELLEALVRYLPPQAHCSTDA